MCVTDHWITTNWKLKKCVLDIVDVDDHTANTQFVELVEILQR